MKKREFPSKNLKTSGVYSTISMFEDRVALYTGSVLKSNHMTMVLKSFDNGVEVS